MSKTSNYYLQTKQKKSIVWKFQTALALYVYN